MTKARCWFRGDGYCDGPLQQHHVIPKVRIKDELGRGSDIAKHACCDPRNLVTLCHRHHHRVTHYFDPNPMPNEVWDFARDYGLEASLYRPTTTPVHKAARPERKRKA